MALANSSFPTPVSPVISTGSFPAAIASQYMNRLSIFLSPVMIDENASGDLEGFRQNVMEQQLVLSLEKPEFQRPFHARCELVGVHRLGQVVECALSDAADRGLDVVDSGQHYHRDVRVFEYDFLQQALPRYLGHDHVQQNRLGIGLRHDAHGLRFVQALQHVIDAEELEGHGGAIECTGFVVNEKDWMLGI